MTRQHIPPTLDRANPRGRQQQRAGQIQSSILAEALGASVGTVAFWKRELRLQGSGFRQHKQKSFFGRTGSLFIAWVTLRYMQLYDFLLVLRGEASQIWVWQSIQPWFNRLPQSFLKLTKKEKISTQTSYENTSHQIFRM